MSTREATPAASQRTLSGPAVITARYLLAGQVQELLDDPWNYEEARESWGEFATLATDLGLDIAEVTLHEGTPFERKRLSEIVGVDLPTGEQDPTDDYLDQA